MAKAAIMTEPTWSVTCVHMCPQQGPVKVHPRSASTPYQWCSSLTECVAMRPCVCMWVGVGSRGRGLRRTGKALAPAHSGVSLPTFTVTFLPFLTCVWG